MILQDENNFGEDNLLLDEVIELYKINCPNDCSGNGKCFKSNFILPSYSFIEFLIITKIKIIKIQHVHLAKSAIMYFYVIATNRMDQMIVVCEHRQLPNSS